MTDRTCATIDGVRYSGQTCACGISFERCCATYALCCDACAHNELSIVVRTDECEDGCTVKAVIGGCDMPWVHVSGDEDVEIDGMRVPRHVAAEWFAVMSEVLG